MTNESKNHQQLIRNRTKIGIPLDAPLHSFWAGMNVAERKAKFKRLREQGLSYAVIGKMSGGISRQRVFQILNGNNI